MQTNEAKIAKQSRDGQSRSSYEVSVMEMEQRTLTDPFYLFTNFKTNVLKE
jgi:hypothetical protein